MITNRDCRVKETNILGERFALKSKALYAAGLRPIRARLFQIIAKSTIICYTNRIRKIRKGEVL